MVRITGEICHRIIAECILSAASVISGIIRVTKIIIVVIVVVTAERIIPIIIIRRFFL